MQQYIVKFLIICALSLSIGACSKTEVSPNAATREAMPEAYSRDASETYEALAKYFPVDTHVVGFSSYGSLAELVQALPGWKLVSADALSKTLGDLGTHYRLDPSKLKSFYDAGLNTGSGFGAGLVGAQRNVVIVFSVLDQNAFLSWVEHLSEEEFGRPQIEKSEHAGWNLAKLTAMHGDVATVAQRGDVAILVFGQKVMGGASFELATRLIDTVDSENALNHVPVYASYKQKLAGAPIGVIAPGTGELPKVDALEKWVNTCALTVTPASKQLGVRARCSWNQKNAYVQGIQSSIKGKLSAWNAPILHAEGASFGRVLFDPDELIKFVMAHSPESVQNKWEDLKGKLNQRLLGINFEEQVYQNLAGNLIVALYGWAEAGEAGGFVDRLADQEMALYLPLRDAELAGRFFGKISLFEKFIPQDKASIETSDGILHASVKVKGMRIHVTYADGLIAVATDKAIDRVMALYASPDQSPITGVFADAKPQVVSQFKANQASSLLKSACGTKCRRLAEFVEQLNAVDLSVTQEDDEVSVGLGIAFTE